MSGPSKSEKLEQRAEESKSFPDKSVDVVVLENT